MGAAPVDVQGRAQRERLVTAVADEAVELADAAAEVRLTPDLRRSSECEGAGPAKGAGGGRRRGGGSTCAMWGNFLQEKSMNARSLKPVGMEGLFWMKGRPLGSWGRSLWTPAL